MSCPIRNTQEFGRLVDYTAQRLSAEATAAVESHLALCPDCRMTVESQGQIWSALESWEAMPVSTDFDRKLYSRIEGQENGNYWKRLFAGNVLLPSYGWRNTLVPAAAACVTVFAAVMLHLPGASPSLSHHEIGVHREAVEAEQLDRTLEDLEMLRQLSAPPSASQQL